MKDAETLSKLMDFCDQTVGCECGHTWWGEEYTEDPTLFHKKSCPCYGRRDVAAFWFDLEVIEAKLGRRVGKEKT